MIQEIEDDLLIDILENEGALVYRSATVEGIIPCRIISRCKKKSATLGITDQPFDRVIVDAILRKLDMLDLLDVIPYMEISKITQSSQV